MFYTDEQLSMILSAAAPICVEREDDSDDVFYYSYIFIEQVIGRGIHFTTETQLLRELEKWGLA